MSFSVSFRSVRLVKTSPTCCSIPPVFISNNYECFLCVLLGIKFCSTAMMHMKQNAISFSCLWCNHVFQSSWSNYDGQNGRDLFPQSRKYFGFVDWHGMSSVTRGFWIVEHGFPRFSLDAEDNSPILVELHDKRSVVVATASIIEDLSTTELALRTCDIYTYVSSIRVPLPDETTQLWKYSLERW